MNVIRIKSIKDAKDFDLDFLATSNIPISVDFAPLQFISEYYKKK